jgi:hypothetical protein
MRILRIVYRREPVKKTGSVSNTVFFNSTEHKLVVDWLSDWPSLFNGELFSSKVGAMESVEGKERYDVLGSVVRSNRTQANIPSIDRIHGIQGDISMVAAAVKDPTSSAT